MTERHSSPTSAADHGDTESCLLDPEGGAGAALRGQVPADPMGVVLILHGGAESSRMPVAWWRLAVSCGWPRSPRRSRVGPATTWRSCG